MIDIDNYRKMLMKDFLLNYLTRNTDISSFEFTEEYKNSGEFNYTSFTDWLKEEIIDSTYVNIRNETYYNFRKPIFYKCPVSMFEQFPEWKIVIENILRNNKIDQFLS